MILINLLLGAMLANAQQHQGLRHRQMGALFHGNYFPNNLAIVDKLKETRAQQTGGPMMGMYDQTMMDAFLRAASQFMNNGSLEGSMMNLWQEWLSMIDFGGLQCPANTTTPACTAAEGVDGIWVCRTVQNPFDPTMSKS